MPSYEEEKTLYWINLLSVNEYFSGKRNNKRAFLVNLTNEREYIETSFNIKRYASNTYQYGFFVTYISTNGTTTSTSSTASMRTAPKAPMVSAIASA